MNTIPLPQVSGISTIDAVYRAVESFRDRLEPTIEGPPPLSPLDAFLLNLIVEFCPQAAFVADLACDATSGSSSVVCLANPRALRVVSVASGAPRRLGGASLQGILEEFASEQFGRASRRAFLPQGSIGSAWGLIRTALSPHETPLFIVDPVVLDRSGGYRLDEILDEFPRGLIVAVNVGKAGECGAAQRLVGACRNDSPNRLWLMPEISSSIPTSRLALVAKRNHPFADSLVRRIDHCFTTNFDFLDLVRDSCIHAVERGIADKLDQEIIRLQEDLRRSGEEIERIRHEAHSLREQLHLKMIRPSPKTLILKTRRYLAPAGSRRERTLKAVMRFQRRLRGRAA